MTLTATHFTDLGRVRLQATELDPSIAYAVIDRSIDGVHWRVVRGGSKLAATASNNVLNTNPYFETNVANWSSVFSAISHSTLHAHGTSTGSMRIVPDGVNEFVGAICDAVPVEQGKDYTNSSWVYSVAGWSEILVGLMWLDAGSAVISETLSTLETSVAADAWTRFTVTDQPPVNAVSVQMRVLMGNTPAASDELWVDDSELLTPVGSFTLDDYEFGADVENTYRATYFDANEDQVSQETVAITPLLDSVWLKSVARPFLNLKLLHCGVADGQIGRRGRGGLFDVIGRTNPVAVSDVRSGIEFTLRGATGTFAEAKALDYLLTSGDILFIQAPASSRVPTIHAFCGDTSRQLKGPSVSEVSAWLMPMTEVARPGPFIIGVLATYRTLLDRYATYADVMVAHATYASVLDLIADPSEVVIE